MLPLFGLASMPMYLAPFASLVITSVLIPKASFLGHLSGIIAGYAISTGVFDVLGPLGAVALLVLALAGGEWIETAVAVAVEPSRGRLLVLKLRDAARGTMGKPGKLHA